MKIPSELYSLILENMNHNDVSPEKCMLEPPILNCYEIKIDGSTGKTCARKFSKSVN